MIRTVVLAGLLAIIFYCAFAGSGEASGGSGDRSRAAPARLALRAARQQWMPGSMALLRARSVAVSLRAAPNDPSA